LRLSASPDLEWSLAWGISSFLFTPTYLSRITFLPQELRTLNSFMAIVRLRSTERETKRWHTVSTSLFRRRNLQRGSPARELEATGAYRLGGFMGEGPGKGRRNVFIVTCPLSVARGSQGSVPCILVQTLGNRTFQ
jgi:hypothetical protein